MNLPLVSGFFRKFYLKMVIILLQHFYFFCSFSHFLSRYNSRFSYSIWPTLYYIITNFSLNLNYIINNIAANPEFLLPKLLADLHVGML